MAYQFKNKKFNAIEHDKDTLDFKNSEKTINANSAYGGSTIPDFNPSQTIQSVIEQGGIKQLPLEDIKPRSANEFSSISNKTLSKSILEIGLINPIIVRKVDNKYIIISGHRRFEAYKSIKEDLEVKKLKDSQSVSDELLSHFKTIPAIVFEIVDSQSELLGSDSKYITKEQEEKMYEASNLETRQIGTNDLVKHIDYFYNLINNDSEYKKELLNKINETATRKATKLNMPKAVSIVITDELGFNVSPVYIWRLIAIKEGSNDYPKYQKIALKRIENGEKVNTVYDDFDMARKIYNDENIEKIVKDEYKTRIEKGMESIKDIYNEAYNIRTRKHKKKENVEKYVLNLLKEIKNRNISVDEAIVNVEKYINS